MPTIQKESKGVEMDFDTINIVQNCQKIMKQYKAEKKSGLLG
jgi:hypothetical protein